MAFSLPTLDFSWPLLAAVFALIMARELWNMTYFKRRGIPGPTPLPFIGNLFGLSKGVHHVSRAYAKDYGDYCGTFLFRQKMYVVFNLDMLREMMVKNFSCFVDHTTQVLKNRPADKMLTMLTGDHWRDVRNLISPTFSAAKMKKMSDLVNECCDTLVANAGNLQAEENRVECFSFFGGFTMDGIARCAFGLEVNSQKNPDDPFVKNAKEFTNFSVFSPVFLLSGIFPFMGHLFNFMDIGIIPKRVFAFFRSVVAGAAHLKKQAGPNQRQNFIHLLLNAHEDQDQGREANDLHDLVDEHHGVKEYFDSKRRTKVKLTDDEVLAQTMVFFLGGYETTRTLLGYAAFCLATNPGVQEKLVEEIEEVTPTRQSVDYGSVARMPYLDAVVCETLRLYPPVAAGERTCTETCTINGITFEKGVQVIFPYFAVHHDPKIWPEPEKFDPTRFSKENREKRHPFAWLPFGAGPRNCIGMRFGLMESKMALVRLLQNYRIELDPKTELPVQPSNTSMIPKDGIFVRFTDRN
ncbi:cytochrome P450 3A13-like [Diadema antillarum]|uniref:cytochrome P450 3A13-like n=1 Tax=Diadema antillarum TaxID=105358 RepID=UPI003A8373EA